ncbi:hypothetical protein SAMN05216499_101190 [Actinacidiphila paucisporea]|uniref:Uncharacterized protein n=1 Tax=Actinacidiphila paucisporea TaxID=310782 RepID=A0A1M6TYI4_9ACTN|nr:hypothetical protein SAMN05216499_101190 [Actinacidiphila paucisporea]
MRVDRVHAQLLDERERRRGTDVGQIRGARVEAPGAGCEVGDGPVAGLPRVVGPVPPGEGGGQGGLRLGTDGEEARPVRRDEPLVAVADDVVVRRGVQRQPADRLGGVDQGAGAVYGGGGADRREVGDPPVGGLRGADRDERGPRPHRAGDVLQRDEPQPQVGPGGEGLHQGAEVLLIGDDLGARGERGGDEADAAGDRAGQGDLGERRPGDAGEGGAGLGDGGLVTAGVGPPGGPRVEGAAQGGDRTGRGEGVGGGVEPAGREVGVFGGHRTTEGGGGAGCCVDAHEIQRGPDERQSPSPICGGHA